MAQLKKFAEGSGLGISLEGTVDVENGQEVRPHHYIRSILPEGPVGQNGILRSGDELLEVFYIEPTAHCICTVILLTTNSILGQRLSFTGNQSYGSGQCIKRIANPRSNDLRKKHRCSRSTLSN